MARQVRNSKLDTRTARAKLPARKAPYWTPITRGCALGYRKGTKSGVWIAKYAVADARKETRLGAADDVLDADNLVALDFAQAQEKARQWFAMAGRDAAGEETLSGPYTVADAARDYMDWFKDHRKSVQDTGYVVNAHILPALGKVEVVRLNARKIREWRDGLAKAPARLRTRSGRDQNFSTGGEDPDWGRKRRSTANRVLTVLKAILNHAWRHNKVPSDDAWRRVEPFPGADSAKVRYLTADECRRLVNACAIDFRPLVQAALYTGCRYGELTRLSVSDFNPDSGTVMVQESKSGRPRHVVLAEEGQAFFETTAAGRPGDAPMFPRPDGARWGRSQQSRPFAKACKHARISPAVSFHILRHTYASLLAMKGAPLQVIALNLGHADTRMVEKHYAHLAPSHVSDAIRSAMPSLGISGTTNIAGLRQGA